MRVFRERRIGETGGAVGIEGFYNSGEGAEGSEDAAGVNWRMVGDVVQDA